MITEFIIEIAIEGPGYLISRSIRASKIEDVDVDGGPAAITGILFSVFVAIPGYAVKLTLLESG